MMRMLAIASAAGLMMSVLMMPGAAFAQSDQDLANSLWQALSEADLVGEKSVKTRPYEGTQPHGKILEYLEQEIEIDGASQRAIVKKNYAGEAATIEKVWADGRDLLASVTVMLKQPGYDPDNQDWFWVKYMPDGGIEVAGKADNCIQCHQAAPGDDYIYSY